MIKFYIQALLIGAASAGLTYRDTACTAGDITSNGRACKVECGIDHAGSDITGTAVSNFQACINACTADKNCKTAQYLTSNSYCYLKSAIGPASSNANVNGVVCPDSVTTTTTASTSKTTTSSSTASTAASTSKTTTSSSTTSAVSAASCVAGPVTINGRVGNVECDTDRSGGDYTNINAAAFRDCENACASDTKCKTAQYLAGSKTCYLKSVTNPPVQKVGVNGIVFAATASSSSSTTSSSSSTTSSITRSISSTTSSTISTAPSVTTSASSTIHSTSTSTTTADRLACSAGYVTLNNRKAVVQCFVDYPGPSYKFQYTGSLQPCEELCAADPQCAVATYDFEQGYCYLKSQASPSPTHFRADAIKFLPTSTAPPAARCTTAAPDSPYLLNGGFERGNLDLILTQSDGGKLPPRRGNFTTSFSSTGFEGCQAYYGYPSEPPDTTYGAHYTFGLRYYGLQPSKDYVLTFFLGGYPNSYPGSSTLMNFYIWNDAGNNIDGLTTLGSGTICTNRQQVCQIPADNNSGALGFFYSIPFTQGADGGAAIYFDIGWQQGTDPMPFLIDDIRINLPEDAPKKPPIQTNP